MKDVSGWSILSEVDAARRVAENAPASEPRNRETAWMPGTDGREWKRDARGCVLCRRWVDDSSEPTLEMWDTIQSALRTCGAFEGRVRAKERGRKKLGFGAGWTMPLQEHCAGCTGLPKTHLSTINTFLSN